MHVLNFKMDTEREMARGPKGGHRMRNDKPEKIKSPCADCGKQCASPCGDWKAWFTYLWRQLPNKEPLTEAEQIERATMKDEQRYPCSGCRARCRGLDCQKWRLWFAPQWQELRRYFGREESNQTEEAKE